MTTFGKHDASGLNLSDPGTLTRPRPPWRRRDPHRERCGVCGIGAVYVVTALLSMQSPTLTLPATLVVLSCERHTRRTVGALESTGVHVREELLYETWGLRWTMFAEAVATPFVWMGRTIASWTPSARRAARERVRIAEQSAAALKELHRAQVAERAMHAPTVLVEPVRTPPSLPDSIDSSSVSKP